ncbi:MAG TPA: carboxypeptidase-like regulatory domain-containing protein [Thermoanaerobaculia bacterium]|nr:carboxypeptidase-like regulatory domain-containing protein [Thermoanaerobaculia bacterium]
MRRCLPAAVLSIALCAGCATPPTPTAANRALAANPRATVEGRVVDSAGRPVEGVRVQAIPGAEISWAPPAPTDADGRFHLSLLAPADYAFLVYQGDVAVLTPSPRDPSQVRITVASGETRRGIELTLLRRERDEVLYPKP